MRDIATKVDASSNLTASEFNSFMSELENAVTRSGQSLDSGLGPDTDLFQLARAILLHAQAGKSYQDGGSANSFVLTAVQSYQQPTAYFDGMTVIFKAAATNTGACTINVSGIGSVSATKAGGGAYSAGNIVAGNILMMRYFSASNRFEEVANTTPPPIGAAEPDQVAVYTDTGSASAISLAIKPGYTIPSAFTDQMVVIFRAAATNDGVGTHPCSISGLGTKNVVEKDGGNPAAGRITAGDWVLMVFRETRDAFEIAFVYDKPVQAAAVPATVSSSSGTLVNLTSAPNLRAPTAYVDGMVVIYRQPQTNTGSVDINLNGIGAVDLRKQDGTNFASGELPSGAIVIAQFITSESRFRAMSGDRPTVTEILSAGRSAFSNTILNPSMSANQRVAVNWGSPVHDDLSFYDAGNDRFAGVSGVQRVDIICNLFPGLGGAADFSGEIQINGTLVARACCPGVENLGEGVSLAVFDVPISTNEPIEIFAETEGTGAGITLAGNITVRASKFA